MDILKKNLDSISGFSEHYEEFKKLIYDVETTKNNLLTLKSNNIYIHSKYDPVKESEKIVEFLLKDTEDLDIIIIFGWGLGYIVKILYEKLLKSLNLSVKPYLLIIEKDLNIFLTSLYHFDFEEILKDNNVKIFLNSEKEMIGSFIQSVATKKVRYYNHRPSYLLNHEYYKKIQLYINYVLNRKDMNNATFKRFQKLWINNIINNLPYYLQSNHLNKLKNIANTLTTIVVAGGPNLDKCISYLQKIKNNVIIIAVDTVCKLLINNDIIPDIIATIDPQYWNYKFLENVKITDSIIVTDSSVYYKIFQLSDTQRYFVGNSIFPLIKYFDDDERGTLGAGGSVATIAFDTARIIGSQNIVLIGLDLSFPDRKTHFHGAYFETNFLAISNYFQTSEDHSYKYLTNVNLELIDSTNGKVFSDSRMILFKKWFDREIQLTNSKVFLPDLGGAKIDGTIIIELKNMPVEYENSDKKTYKNRINGILKTKNIYDMNGLIKKIEKYILHSKDLKNKYNKIISFISDEGIVDEKNMDIINTNETFIRSDSELFTVLKILSSSSQDMIISILENFKFNNNEKQSGWIKTKLLYKSIIESIDYHEKTFNKLLNKIKINPNIFNREW